MLLKLLVKDYALIELAEVEFRPGLNIITGETGAGKSILIGALGLLIGDRANAEVIRKGAKKAIVEGEFDISGIAALTKILDEFEIEYEDEIIIRREISLKGANRVFLNDTPVSLAQVKRLGNLLVDMHGQHEHQSLLQVDKHIDFLDRLGDYENLLSDFGIKISLLEDKKRELKKLKQREKELKEKEELYRFQLNEIETVSPEENEDEELSAQLRILENSEHILRSANEIYSFIYEGEESIYDKVSLLKKMFSDLTRFDKEFIAQEDEIQSALTSLAEAASFVLDYGNGIELDEEALEAKRERLGAINLLKKKYGGSLAAVLELRDKLESELNLAVNFTKEISALENEIENLRVEAGLIAERISDARKNTAESVSPKIESELHKLGMEEAIFDVKFVREDSTGDDFIYFAKKKVKYNEKGADIVEFMISTNKGEDLKPLAKIASGGEISRVMLALKTILAEKDAIPLLIFDEIDVGISGRIAQKVAETMRGLGKTHQVIAISHLPQIAAFGNHHFVIEKEETKERVISKIRPLNKKERISELAKLISGEKIVPAAIEHANELIKLSETV